MDPQFTDQELLKRFVRGDQNALGELARRYELPLLGLARGMLGGRRDAAMDAIQETWMRVIRYGHTFNGRSNVKTWVYRIAINQCRNIQSKQSIATPSTSDSPAMMAATNTSDDIARSCEQGSALNDAVQQLNDAKRSVVLLCYHAGMTHEQAAEILEIPLGTLKSRLSSALQELRAKLSSEVLA